MAARGLRQAAGTSRWLVRSRRHVSAVPLRSSIVASAAAKGQAPTETTLVPHFPAQDEVLIAGFGRRGHAVGDIPGVRFKVVKVSGVSLLALFRGKKEKVRPRMIWQSSPALWVGRGWFAARLAEVVCGPLGWAAICRPGGQRPPPASVRSAPNLLLPSMPSMRRSPGTKRPAPAAAAAARLGTGRRRARQRTRLPGGGSRGRAAHAACTAAALPIV